MDQATFPISAVIHDLKKALLSENTIILQAPPGAGKSTILPLQLINEPWLNEKKIIMLEPRRLAARSVAERMSDLISEPVGKAIGYRIRFESKITASTRIEVVTEGILTRMLQQDNALENVALIIFDEFHERSIHADLSLALCRQVQEILRNDLRILIMSATLDTQILSDKLKARVITSMGRQFPVTYKYHEPDSSKPLVNEMFRLIKKAFFESSGDILVFLPGAGEIIKLKDLLEGELSAVIHVLYGELSFSEQQKALMPDKDGFRKIVLSTSIAETSLTIEGITVVVDSGYSRVPKYDPNTGLTKLTTIRVTKDVAEQRAGRAGRLSEGACYRLWSEGYNQHLHEKRQPEILDAELSPLLLEIYKWGETINSLKWIDKPPSAAISTANNLLETIGAIKNSNITPHGKIMADLPVHPRIAHMMLMAGESLSLACDLAALMEDRDIFKNNAGANLALRVEALRKYRRKEHSTSDRNAVKRIEKASQSLHKLLNKTVSNIHPDEYTCGLLLSYAYPERIAKRSGKNQYRLANGRTAFLDEHDPLTHEEFLCIANLDGKKNNSKIFLAAPLNIDDIYQHSETHFALHWDYQHMKLVSEKQIKLGDLILKSTRSNEINNEEHLEIIVEVIRKQGLDLFNFSVSATALRNRIQSAALWKQDISWPGVSDEALLKTASTWILPYYSKVKSKDHFKEIDMEDVLKSMLDYEGLSKLNTIAPESIKVPSGSSIKLTYSPDGSSPVLSVRIQELFGLTQTPSVNNGKIQVLIHLLSPGYKPVQVTQDLKSFWQNTYPIIRKELRIRYPRHHWPEDPWTAEAVRGVKKKLN